MRIKKWSEIIRDGGLVVVATLEDVETQGDFCPLVIYGAGEMKPAMEGFPLTMPDCGMIDGFGDLDEFKRIGMATVEDLGTYGDHMESMYDSEKEMVVYELDDLKLWRDKLNDLIESMGEV